MSVPGCSGPELVMRLEKSLGEITTSGGRHTVKTGEGGRGDLWVLEGQDLTFNEPVQANTVNYL